MRKYFICIFFLLLLLDCKNPERNISDIEIPDTTFPVMKIDRPTNELKKTDTVWEVEDEHHEPKELLRTFPLPTMKNFGMFTHCFDGMRVIDNSILNKATLPLPRKVIYRSTPIRLLNASHLLNKAY
jgi:hypothetical protein